MLSDADQFTREKIYRHVQLKNCHFYLAPAFLVFIFSCACAYTTIVQATLKVKHKAVNNPYEYSFVYCRYFYTHEKVIFSRAVFEDLYHKFKSFARFLVEEGSSRGP